MDQLLMSATALSAPALTADQLWSGSTPRKCFACYTAPLPMETRSQRLVLKGSRFWTRVDGPGLASPFAACARKEMSVTLEADKKESDTMIRWIYRCTVITPTSAPGHSWTREICVLKSSISQLRNSEQLCLIGIIQRETLRSGKRTNGFSIMDPVAADESLTRSAKRVHFNPPPVTQLPKQLVPYECWSLTLQFAPEDSVPSDWASTWASHENIDLWTLSPLARMHAVSLVSAVFGAVASFWDADELNASVDPTGARFLLSMASFRSPNLANPQQLETMKSLMYQIEARLLNTNYMRVRLPRGFLSNRTTSENVRLTHWTGGAYVGPLKNGVPHGMGKYYRGSPETLLAEHEGLYMNGFPHGEGFSRVTICNRMAMTYTGDFCSGGFGKRGRVEWSDGSYYEGDVSHKDWIYLESRITGTIYRVSAVLPFTPVSIEPLPTNMPRPRMKYEVGRSKDEPVGIERLLLLIESNEVLLSTQLTAVLCTPVPEAQPLEPLPTEDRLFALLDSILESSSSSSSSSTKNALRLSAC